MLRPHDTDRILAVLGEAIEKLRQEASDLDAFNMFQAARFKEIANDLALLHGAVSAEAQRHDEEETRVNEVRQAFAHKLGVRLPRGAVPKDIDVKRSEAGRLRYLHREEIEQEVLNGEHREED